MTGWLVCRMDDGVLRRTPTRRAGRDWALDLYGGQVLERHTGAGGYEYILGYPREDHGTGTDVFIVRAAWAEANGIDLHQEPLYPYPDPFQPGPRADTT